MHNTHTGYYYRLFLENEEVTIGAVQKIDQSTESLTFLDKNGEIVAMLNRDMIRGMIRIEKSEREPETPPEEPERQPKPKPPTVKTTQQDEPKSPHPAEKQLKPPINVQPSLESAIQKPKTGQPYQWIKNLETKGYEVDVTQPDKETAVAALTGMNNALQQAAVSIEPPIYDDTARKAKDQTEEQLIEMQFKKVHASGLYNPITKKVLIEKGTLIVKKETNSLRKSKNHDGVRTKRRAIFRKSTKPHNREYDMLTEDIEFSSLSQACCALSGAIIPPNQYWKFID